jgi:hypothetical protein
MRKTARLVLSSVLLTMLLVPSAEAAGTRVIVRVTGGLPLINSICSLVGCRVEYGLGDPDGQVFLVTSLTTSAQRCFSRR